MKTKIYTLFVAMLLTSMTIELNAQTIKGTLLQDAVGSGDWSIGGTGENLEIREPEQSNKVWATFQDDWGLKLTGAPNLQVNGFMTVGNKVGIGTTSPQTNLHIFNPTSKSNAILRISATENLGGPIGSVHTAWDLSHNSSNLALEFKYGGSTVGASNINPAKKISFSYDGIIKANSINLTNTGTSITTAGKIVSKEIEVAALNTKTLETEEIKTTDLVVECDNLADYVFDADYALPSLNEVSSYINENSHLPGMPSAAEVKENGMNVAEMNNLLLQKVEELTLYMIELKKENEEIRKKLDSSDL